jgi:2-oxoglutarate ferredoxin oxidoreductase subunit alpha
VIAAEENATGQLAHLAEQHGITVHHRILQYDGRPFGPEDLLKKVKEVTV